MSSVTYFALRVSLSALIPFLHAGVGLAWDSRSAPSLLHNVGISAINTHTAAHPPYNGKGAAGSFNLRRREGAGSQAGTDSSRWFLPCPANPKPAELKAWETGPLRLSVTYPTYSAGWRATDAGGLFVHTDMTSFNIETKKRETVRDNYPVKGFWAGLAQTCSIGSTLDFTVEAWLVLPASSKQWLAVPRLPDLYSKPTQFYGGTISIKF
ncbi:MAG: hypothetical protein V2B18_08695 [Pseudomonadota bacterium]